MATNKKSHRYEVEIEHDGETFLVQLPIGAALIDDTYNKDHAGQTCTACGTLTRFVGFGTKTGIDGKVAKWPVFEKCPNWHNHESQQKAAAVKQSAQAQREAKAQQAAEKAAAKLVERQKREDGLSARREAKAAEKAQKAADKLARAQAELDAAKNSDNGNKKGAKKAASTVKKTAEAAKERALAAHAKRRAPRTDAAQSSPADSKPRTQKRKLTRNQPSSK